MQRAIACFVLLVSFAAPAVAGDLPACLSADAVPELADDRQHGWLSKTSAKELKRQLEKVAGKGKWEGDTLVMPCAIQGPAYNMPALTVEGAGPGVERAAAGRPFFSNLAKRSGHTPGEAEVLAGKYAQLTGTYFRHLRDEGGNRVTEEQLILRRHEKRLGIGAPTEPVASDSEIGDAKALEAKITAAQKRGDMNEVMRLASEGQKLSAALTSRSTKLMEKTDKQVWQMLESAFPELLQASYRTRITFLTCPCLRCRLPE